MRGLLTHQMETQVRIPKVHKFPKRLVKKRRKTSKVTKKFDSRKNIEAMNRRQLLAFDMATNPKNRKKKSGRILKMPYSEEILEKNSYRGEQTGVYWRKDYEKQT